MDEHGLILTIDIGGQAAAWPLPRRAESTSVAVACVCELAVKAHRYWTERQR